MRRGQSKSSQLTELEVLNSIDKKMDKVIKLLALTSVTGLDQTSKIKTLDGLGLNSSEISAYLGIASSTVRVVLHRSRKRGKKSGK